MGIRPKVQPKRPSRAEAFRIANRARRFIDSANAMQKGGRSLNSHERHLLKRLYIHPEEMLGIEEQEAWMRRKKLSRERADSIINSLESRGFVKVSKYNKDLMLNRIAKPLGWESSQFWHQGILSRMSGGALGGREKAMGQTR